MEGFHALLRGIFLTQGSNPQLLCLLHWQVDSFPLCHLGGSWRSGSHPAGPGEDTWISGQRSVSQLMRLSSRPSWSVFSGN